MSFPENLENINTKGEMHIIYNDNHSIFTICFFHLIKTLSYIIPSLCFIAYDEESLSFRSIYRLPQALSFIESL